MADISTAPETVLVPLTGMVRMPLPSKEERAEFIASLEEESAKIKNGQYTQFEKDSFVSWMMEGYENRAQGK
jgi:hypothetical protein